MKVSYYVPKSSCSLLGETSQGAIDYDPMEFKAAFEREYTLNNDVFRNINNYLKQEAQHKEIMKDFA